MAGSGIFIGDLEDFFDKTVTIEPFVSRDQYGKPNSGTSGYGPPVQYPANIPVALRQMAVRTKDGTSVFGRGPIYLPVAPMTITVNDRITLPAGYSPAQPPILQVSPFGDEEGNLATQIVVG